jgi:DNA-binding MarR family transcriptional regulator
MRFGIAQEPSGGWSAPCDQMDGSAAPEMKPRTQAGVTAQMGDIAAELTVSYPDIILETKPARFMQTSLAHLLGTVAGVLRDSTIAGLADLGLTPRTVGVLEAIAAAGGGGQSTQRALGEARGIDRTTMVAVLDQLERSALIVRSPQPQDRRAHRVTMSPRGVRVLAQARLAVEAAEDGVMAALSEEDRGQMQRSLASIVEASDRNSQTD